MPNWFENSLSSVASFANNAVVLSHCLHNQHLARRTLDVGSQVGQVGFCIGDAACSQKSLSDMPDIWA